MVSVRLCSKPHVASWWEQLFILSENLGCATVMKNFNAVLVALLMPIIPFSHLTTQTLSNKPKMKTK